MSVWDLAMPQNNKKDKNSFILIISIIKKCYKNIKIQQLSTRFEHITWA